MPSLEKVQTILNDCGEPVFAVIPYADFKEMERHLTQAESTTNLELESDWYISLPEAPGEKIDLVRLVDYLLRQSNVAFSADDDKEEKMKDFISHFPVNARTQALAAFEGRTAAGLDTLIRRFFLPSGSPYADRMQATKAVVDSLVATGLFRRSKRKFDFYRPVNALEFDDKAAKEFMKGKPAVKDPIPTYYWLQ